ncbi:MAG: MFS transporter [Neisseriaceae bacterium]|nr:MAG: MFS transporter [Neisseriaceae bacterium]
MFKLLALTLILSTIGAIAAEMYIPALPFIGASFHASDTVIQYSFTAFIFGSLAPALFFGSLADCYGRRKVIMIALVVGLLGTVGCLYTDSVYAFIFYRFVQGFGFSSTNGIGRALLRDHCEGKEFAKYSSYLSMAFALSVDITPFLGGVIQHHFNWRAIFVFLFLFNLLSIAVAWKFPFKAVVEKRKFNLKNMFRDYKVICINREYMHYNLIATLMYSVFMSYLAVAAFIWETRLGLTPDQFGLLALFLSGFYVSGCYVNSHLVCYGLERVLQLGVFLVLCSGVILLSFALNDSLTRIQFFGVLGLIFFASGLVFANASALAMSSINSNFASASALFSFSSVAGSAVITAIINFFNPTSIMPLALIVIILAIMAHLILFTLKNFSQVNYAEQSS